MHQSYIFLRNITFVETGIFVKIDFLVKNENFGEKLKLLSKTFLTLRQSHSLHPQVVNGQIFAHPVFGTFGTKKNIFCKIVIRKGFSFVFQKKK